MKRRCACCKKYFFKTSTDSKKYWNTKKFCSRDCFWKNGREDISGSKNHLWKGGKRKYICPTCKLIFHDYKSNKRKFCSVKCLSNSIKGKHRFETAGKKNHNWKGNNVTYWALHHWVRRWKPKPKFCEHCEEEKRLDVSNISGKYKRDINDYWYLCRKCHIKFDRGLLVI